MIYASWPKITIVYTGSIYYEYQDIAKLFQAIRNLLDEGKIKATDIPVKMYGTKNEFLQKIINKYELQYIVEQCGKVSHDESIQKQREASLLLLLNWEDSNDKGVIPLKVYEYLAAMRPILATGGYSGDEVERILRETNAGQCARSVKDIEMALIDYIGRIN